jgi:hypothetical protein
MSPSHFQRAYPAKLETADQTDNANEDDMYRTAGPISSEIGVGNFKRGEKSSSARHCAEEKSDLGDFFRQAAAPELLFAAGAPDLSARGLAVIPLGPDRKPRASGFNRWSRPPGRRTVARWCEEHPADNIGVVPGLSRKVVVDCDTHDQVDEVQELLGHTDLRTRTSRGMHLWYESTSVRSPGNLRRYGLNVDIKGGNSIVIAPPSRHESGHIYRLDGCDWSALEHLRRPDVEKLRKFMQQHDRRRPAVEVREMRDGSRGQWLNDLLCSHAMSCDGMAELLDVAMTANQRLADRGLEPLEDEEVVKRTEKVWKDAEAGKLEQWMGREAVVRSRRAEIVEIARLSKAGAPDAFMLLMCLRASHSARCRRGETFAITPKAMAQDGVIPGWEWKRYARARDLLLLGGFVEKVSGFTATADGRRAAQYTLPSFTGAGAVPVTLGPGIGPWPRQTGGGRQ